MGVVKNLMVRAGADFSAITTQANKAKSAMSGMQTSVSKSCSKMTAAVSGVNKVLGLLGVGLSVAGIVALTKSAKEAYDEQAEASAKLAQVMRNTMSARSDEIKSIEDLIDAQERLGVVKGDVQTEAAQELGTYLTLSSSLKTLIPVLNDMVAQQYGIGASAESAVSIATMMGKVMNGQTSALSRYGYSFTEAQEAILKYGTEEQRAATLAEVVEESVGGMNAALAATPNGRLQQVSNTLDKIKENFGQAVNNVLVLFIPALNTVCSVLANVATLANKVAQTLANVFGGGSSAAAATVTYTGAVASAVEEVEDSATSAGEAMQALMGFDQITKLTDSSSSSGTADSDDGAAGGITEVSGASDEAGESIGWLEQRLTALKEKFAGIDTSKLETSLSRLKEAVAPLTEGLFSGLSWAMDNIFVPLASWTIEDALPAFLDAVAGAADVLSAALDALKPYASWLWENFLQPIVAWTGDLFISALEDIADLLHDLADLISGNTTFGEFIADLSPAQTALLGIATALGAIKLALMGMAGFEAITTFISAVKNLGATSLIGKLAEVIMLTASGAGTLSEAMAAVFGPGSIIAGIAAVIGGAVLAITNFISMLKNGFSWVNEALMLVGIAIVAVGAIILGAPALVAGVIAAIVAAVATLVVVIKEHWTEIKEFFSQLWEKIKDIFSSAWEAIKGFFSGAWEAIKITWGAVGAWFSGVGESIKSAFSTAWTNIKGVWNSVGSWFTTNVITPISSGFKNFANGIIGFFEGIVNSGISGVNKLIGAINKISFNVPSWVPVIGGKTFGFNLREVSKISLPRLATGAVIPPNQEFLAVLGDQKKGYNIEAPADLIKQMVLEAMMEAGGTGNRPAPMQLTIPVYVGGRKVTEVVIDDVNEIIKTTGVCPIKI